MLWFRWVCCCWLRHGSITDLVERHDGWIGTGEAVSGVEFSGAVIVMALI